MSTGTDIERDDVLNLLQTLTSPQSAKTEISQRRNELLHEISSRINARGGFWGWGRGRPGITAVTPVASIPFGFTADEWMTITAFCMAPAGRDLIQRPIFARLTGAERATVRREDLLTDREWYDSPIFLEQLKPYGFDHFVTSVQYCSADQWFCMTFMGQLGQPGFSQRDADLIDLVMEGVVWLQPQASDSIEPDVFADITPRQRMVMMYLLEGMSRKQIAAQLGLTQHTINDHVKNLYLRFQVSSATELAARFLKST